MNSGKRGEPEAETWGEFNPYILTRKPKPRLAENPFFLMFRLLLGGTLQGFAQACCVHLSSSLFVAVSIRRKLRTHPRGVSRKSFMKTCVS
jgi:hypothetical protein